MFRKLPIILLISILILFLIDPWISLSLKQSMYALSLSIKSLIIFILPFLIFMLLFKAVSQFAKNATKWLLFILVAICCSNFISTLISYFIGNGVYHLNFTLMTPSSSESLAAAWNFQMPKLLSNDFAMISAIILGILCSWLRPAWAKEISSRFDRVVQYILKLLLWIIPLFLVGFAVKMIHEKTMQNLAAEYSCIFLIVAISQFAYISLLFLFLNRMQWRSTLEQGKNILPAAIAGFSSMSSAAAMPLTIVAAEKNTQNPSFARFAIPMTVNSHLIGDCFAIPIFAFAVMKHFGALDPSLMSYLIFAVCFVIAKFSVAAVPGGGILVMLPILEGHLGFTPEMASLITALYILFDPIITCANVSGNSAFAVILNKLISKKTDLSKA
jgi:Na+/H+-dicarboxylate symporter